MCAVKRLKIAIFIITQICGAEKPKLTNFLPQTLKTDSFFELQLIVCCPSDQKLSFVNYQ